MLLEAIHGFWQRLGWWAFRMDRMLTLYEHDHPGKCGLCSYYRYLNRECRYLGPPPEHACKERAT
jgi:hypothetical protein